MAKKLDPEKIKKAISYELLALEESLSKCAQGIVLNSGALKSSANTVKEHADKNTWQYQIRDLEFLVNCPQQVIPSDCGGSLKIIMNFEISGNCVVENSIEEIQHLVFEISVQSSTKDYHCSWHFDRHIQNSSHASHDAHPLFHFQHGGHAMKAHSADLGKMLLLPAPRIGFPPMDAALAIDFLLSNFAGECWQQLRADTSYSRIQKASQNRHWKPYIEALASWWVLGPKSNANAISSLWPQLID